MGSKINPGQLVIYIAIVFAICASVFASLFGRMDALVLAMGVGLISHGLGQEIPVSLLLASIAAFLGAYLPFGVTEKAEIAGFSEGFSGGDEDFEEESLEGDGEGLADKEEGFEESEGLDDGEGFKEKDEGEGLEGEGLEGEGEGFSGENDEGLDEEGLEEEGLEDRSGIDEGFANPEKKTRKKRRPPPDNANHKGMFELGKKYKIPSEKDDPDYHLDAGTTFMNAYKSLKPDQISAMTKDTQELINTQKQLMSTLNTLKPLMSDGKQIMDTFQNYFGAGGLGNMDQLGAMAEKFSGK